MKTTIITFLIAFTATLFLTAAPSNAQTKKCANLPEVEWWSNTHAKVTRIVERRYQGNWGNYIDRWTSYLTRMKKLYEANSVAVVKLRGIKLQGKQLADHIKDIQTRISVLGCLKTNQEASIGEDLESLETAANGPPPQTFQVPEVKQEITQTAAVSNVPLDIEVTATCNKDMAVFQITNLGEKWPRLGEINIYRVDGKALLTKRRVRMANSQQATFRIRKRGSDSYGTLGVWVSPTWEKRSFRYDAKIKCQ